MLNSSERTRRFGPTPKARGERFWAKVDRSGTCWLWTAGTMGAGYGKFMWAPGEETGAHRASYLLSVNDIPAGMDVCHTCDNPLCVRPSHLFVGTRTDNMQDAARKGRQRTVPLKGGANGRAMLSEADVRAIRAESAAGTKPPILARRFGVTNENIYSIIARRTWKHVA